MKSDSKTYLITLKPLEPYFFGGEKLSETGNKNNFYVKSIRYPQQTALLGMLRHFMLIRHGLIDDNELTDRRRAAALIGPSSFAVGVKRQFGCIKELSPVGIRYRSHNYWQSPLDLDLSLEETSLKTSFGGSNSYEKTLQSKGYDPKKELPDSLISNGGVLTLPDGGEVFTPVSRPGITKSRSGKREDQAYYRQQYIRLHDACAFAFYANISLPESLDGLEELMTMGGERSPFMLKFTEVAIPDFDRLRIYPENQPDCPWNKLVLLSDTYTLTDIVKKADFSINASVSFRCIGSKISVAENDKSSVTSEYYKLKYQEDVDEQDADKIKQPLRSQRYFLHQRGSVFYFQNPEMLKEIGDDIENQENFRQIGYNHFITYPLSHARSEETL